MIKKIGYTTLAIVSLFVSSTNVQAGPTHDFKPTYKFRSDLQCWPTPPASGQNSGTCTSKTSFQGNKPAVYYELYDEVVAGKAHKLATYWLYYGNQNGCTSLDNGHDDDWEAVTVHSVDGVMYHVTYSQHNGRYTLAAADVPKTGGRPVVYVGKYSHGNYHDQRSRASWDSWAYATGDYCYYWKDPRGPGVTWTPGLSSLNNVGVNSTFPGSTNPLNRSTKPYQQTVCREDGGQVLAGIINATENTCDRNPSYLQDENMLLRDMFYLNIY